jgi:hypothetical protein
MFPDLQLDAHVGALGAPRRGLDAPPTHREVISDSTLFSSLFPTLAKFDNPLLTLQRNHSATKKRGNMA